MERIATGLYRHARGYRVRVSMSAAGRTVSRQRTFPPDTPLDALTAWRAQTRRILGEHLERRHRLTSTPRVALPSNAGWIKAPRRAPIHSAIGALWQVEKDLCRATADVWRHPDGLELRIARGRRTAVARVFPDSRTLFDAALVTLERFKARGWSVIEC